MSFIKELITFIRLDISSFDAKQYRRGKSICKPRIARATTLDIGLEVHMILKLGFNNL